MLLVFGVRFGAGSGTACLERRMDQLLFMIQVVARELEEPADIRRHAFDFGGVVRVKPADSDQHLAHAGAQPLVNLRVDVEAIDGGHV